MTGRFLALALTLLACETPPLTLRYSLTDGASQQCISANTGNETTDCEDITIECPSVLSIRIVPPDKPEVPYVTVCEPLPTSGQRKLCSIAGVDLPQPTKPIPEQVLEVQMAVFPRSAVSDLDGDGDLDCPRVEFGVDGLPVTDTVPCYQDPVACLARPAVGGRAFYQPGDSETHVELGCTELELLRTCAGETRTEVIATVNEFEYPVSVDLATAGNLFVSIGEPMMVGSNSYALDSSKAHQLPLDPVSSLPTWSDTVALGLMASYCIEVLEDTALATRTLTCRVPENLADTKLDVTALRLKPETLSTILKALYGAPVFPSKGLVVGIVLDQSFAPVANATVMPDCGGQPCKVKYLTANKLAFVETMTSSNGIWVSEDAPYMSTFSRMGLPVSAFGGLVENKVTTVVLQEASIGGGM